ncbi:sulfotransferase domain-containing protein [Fictibacillus nanhaiensis]|uniref:sulfotransferase domain-containing protein n=1 Tax=Fictibacillus nanhaiensis TaxID=742169 RepID=UPI001C93E121|nr:sulfotransferase domain-containing protein [Fictibacillus nanhaiensis]MBY6036563.1 sulfotransferase domain-containing protein [Fictibacillus nanhaiensis]
MIIKPFILNSVPKSGTHLLLQIIEGIPEMKLVLPYIMGYMNEENPHNIQRITSIPANHFIYGHLFYSTFNAEKLNNNKVKQLFLIRDPRDIIVSLYYYMYRTLPDHPVLRYANEYNLTKEQIINHLITGIKEEEFAYSGTNVIIGTFTKWIGDPNVLVLKYEDVREPGKQDHEFYRILYHLTDGKLPSNYYQIIQAMKKNIEPSKSGTFRKGTSGGWKTEFTNSNIKTFIRECQDLLEDMGYE